MVIFVIECNEASTMKMIEYENTLIRKYENFIRNIVNSSVLGIDFDKLDENNKMFVDKTKELLKFENNKSWSFLVSSLDTLGDSQFAIISFLNHKIDNHKIFNTGEKYLRLYGILSAIYIHYRAIATLADLVKIKTNELENDFKKSKISFLRNAISSHPVNFNNNGTKTNYKIARHSVNDRGQLVLVSMENKFETYDLYKSINDYLLNSELTLEKISKKLIHNRYKNSIDKIDYLEEELKKIKPQR